MDYVAANELSSTEESNESSEPAFVADCIFGSIQLK